MLFKTNCPEQTEAIGERLARALLKNKKRAFVAMRGEMGVGKTAFTRGFARALGISGVKSPTYTVVNEYRGAVRLFHYDMYRIEDEDELYSIGFYDYADRNGICLVEWSENIIDFLPEKYIKVEIVKDLLKGENYRKISVQFGKNQ